MEEILKVPLVVTDFCKIISLYFHWSSKPRVKENYVYCFIHFNYLNYRKESDTALWESYISKKQLFEQFWIGKGGRDSKTIFKVVIFCLYCLLIKTFLANSFFFSSSSLINWQWKQVVSPLEGFQDIKLRFPEWKVFVGSKIY